jgi:hypothetical protein
MDEDDQELDGGSFTFTVCEHCGNPLLALIAEDGEVTETRHFPKSFIPEIIEHLHEIYGKMN